jgi:hypothetical protein
MAGFDVQAANGRFSLLPQLNDGLGVQVRSVPQQCIEEGSGSTQGRSILIRIGRETHLTSDRSTVCACNSHPQLLKDLLFLERITWTSPRVISIVENTILSD